MAAVFFCFANFKIFQNNLNVYFKHKSHRIFIITNSKGRKKPYKVTSTKLSKCSCNFDSPMDYFKCNYLKGKNIMFCRPEACWKTQENIKEPRHESMLLMLYKKGGIFQITSKYISSYQQHLLNLV